MMTDQETRTSAAPDELYYRRRDQSRRWGGLLVLAGVIWLVFLLANRGPLFGFGFGNVERSAPIPTTSYAVTTIEVIGVNDNIELVGWSSDEVQLSGTRYGYGWNNSAAAEALEALTVVARQEGDRLVIEVQREPGLRMLTGQSPYAAIELMLPAGVSVEARTVNGDISGEDVRADLLLGSVNGEIALEGIVGDVTLDTTNGDVELRDLRGALTAGSISGDLEVSGDIRSAQIETVNGTVDLEGLSGEISISSINGEIRLSDLRDALVNVESTNGDIFLEGALARNGESRISNISGDIITELSAPDGIRVEATSVSGDIDSDMELRDRREERRSLSGIIGEGSALLRLNTTSGDITLEE